MSNVVHRDSCKCNEDTEEWYVNAPEYHNCFFTYMRHNSRPHTLNEISKLLGMSIAAVTAIEQKATEKMKRRLNDLEKVKKLKGL
jgi:DNA-directed RNA polymerase sigma subunit (sigma70/sigma32)